MNKRRSFGGKNKRWAIYIATTTTTIDPSPVRCRFNFNNIYITVSRGVCVGGRRRRGGGGRKPKAVWFTSSRDVINIGGCRTCTNTNHRRHRWIIRAPCTHTHTLAPTNPSCSSSLPQPRSRPIPRYITWTRATRQPYRLG